MDSLGYYTTDKQRTGKSLWNFVLYVITASSLLYAQRWKDLVQATVEEWLVKTMKFAEMAKLATSIRERQYLCLRLETL